jgi:decaprenylphospho-beta-D-erythro-pentofuranosid-2-ulose 2-reductase
MENAFGQPQNVVVLGGTSDIARAVTKKLCAARTHTVVLAGRNQTLLDAAAKEAQEYGATKVDTVIFDAEDPSDAARCVRESFEKVGEKIDLAIIAVGLLGDQLEQEVDPLAAARMMTVNITWPVAALTEIRNRLIAQGSGRILVMSSVASIRVRRGSYLYSGAKAGLDRLCDGLADSLIGTGVTLQLLRPGFVRSKMTTGMKDIPFSTGVNEVADNVMRGLASGDRVIYSPPILKYVFSVLRHLPAPLWRKVSDR